MGFRVEVVNETQSGPSWVFSPGQVVTFGRTDRAKIAIPNDHHMSSLHFQIEFRDDGCDIVDLGSSNHTHVNGDRITRTSLYPGDIVLAGKTVFRLSKEMPAGTAAPRSQPPAGDRQPIMTTPIASAGFTMTRLPSRICLFDSDADVPVEEVLQYLSKKSPLFLIVDRLKAGLPETNGRSVGEYLFDWVPSELRPTVSPILVETRTLANWPALVSMGWKKDAVTCIFSNRTMHELLGHLRGVLRSKRSESDPGKADAMTGFCWPSAIGAILASAPVDYAIYLMSGIDAIIHETPEGAWRAISGSGFKRPLTEFGLVEIEAKPDEQTDPTIQS